MSEIIEMTPAEEKTEKPYTFRPLEAPDIFPMFKIIKAIGINEFTACFEKDGIKNLIASMTDEGVDQMSSIVGISVVLEIADVIIGNLPKCEAEIYQLLSQTSGISVAKIKKMGMVEFVEMVIEFIKKDEFKDFIKVVSKLFK